MPPPAAAPVVGSVIGSTAGGAALSAGVAPVVGGLTNVATLGVGTAVGTSASAIGGATLFSQTIGALPSAAILPSSSGFFSGLQAFVPDISFSFADFFKFDAGDLLLGAGSFLRAGGQVQAGLDAQSIFDLQAAIERNRAIRERRIAEIEADDFRRRMTATRRKLPTRLVGVQFIGTPLIVDDVLASDIQRGVDRILAGGDAQGAEAEASAVLAELRGDVAARRGVTSAGASLLTGAGEIFS